MASYHLSVKTIKRSAARPATSAAAYRVGERIECQREGPRWRQVSRWHLASGRFVSSDLTVPTRTGFAPGKPPVIYPQN
ncbi:hypothetical protein AB9K34_03445, partial [Sedimentitalea sp. XS_ASV28]